MLGTITYIRLSSSSCFRLLSLSSSSCFLLLSSSSLLLRSRSISSCKRLKHSSSSFSLRRRSACKCNTKQTRNKLTDLTSSSSLLSCSYLCCISSINPSHELKMPLCIFSISCLDIVVFLILSMELSMVASILTIFCRN